MGLAGLARWKTKSTGSATSMNSLTSAARNVNPLSRTCSMFSSVPVSRLSRQMTRWPFSSRYSHRCDPRNPAPPVTTDVVMVVLSICAARADHRAGRLPHDVQVALQRPGLHVLQVEAHHVVEREVTAPADLPEPRDARQHDVPPPVQFFHELTVAQRQRARPDKAHVALEHAEELGQLVEAQTPQDAADAGDPRIVTHFEQRAVGLVELLQRALGLPGVMDHGAKLVEVEGPLTDADALVNEEHRSVRRHLDQGGDDEEQRTQDDQQKRRHDSVRSPLDEIAAGARGLRAHHEEWAVEPRDMGHGVSGRVQLSRDELECDTGVAARLHDRPELAVDGAGAGHDAFRCAGGRKCVSQVVVAGNDRRRLADVPIPLTLSVWSNQPDDLRPAFGSEYGEPR